MKKWSQIEGGNGGSNTACGGTFWFQSQKNKQNVDSHIETQRKEDDNGGNIHNTGQSITTAASTSWILCIGS
jgi:hypothetical protein